MEALPDKTWDVVISGTGLQPSLLALALSRSGRSILHVDPHEYYGGPEAAFSLQEADEWAQRHASSGGGGLFAAAEVKRAEGEGLSFSRAYSLALAPQIIHARSELLAQLVSSRAYRQVEFLAVGSVYIYLPASASSSTPSLSRIPSTREDVFTDTAISARSKRSLMKFLKFVLEYEQESQLEVWRPRADEPLADFLSSEFKFDARLQAYVTTLTLSLDGKISVEAGLAAIHRQLTSMGVFGAGFSAVYPKWGGLSEVAQVGCRAGAVGGAVYMLGTGVDKVQPSASPEDASESLLEVTLSNEAIVKARSIVCGHEANASNSTTRLSRLTAVVKSDLSSVFDVVVEGAPTPAVAVVAFPPGSVSDEERTSEFSIYAMVHSSDTGECPVGQCVLYLSTISGTESKQLLEAALSHLLAAVSHEHAPPAILYQLYYEQTGATDASLHLEENTATFPPPPLDLAFNDSMLGPVREAWNMVNACSKADDDAEYMVFQDREGADDQDEAYD